VAQAQAVLHEPPDDPSGRVPRLADDTANYAGRRDRDAHAARTRMATAAMCTQTWPKPRSKPDTAKMDLKPPSGVMRRPTPRAATGPHVCAASLTTRPWSAFAITEKVMRSLLDRGWAAMGPMLEEPCNARRVGFRKLARLRHDDRPDRRHQVSLNHLVGDREQVRRNGEVERFRGLEVMIDSNSTDCWTGKSAASRPCVLARGAHNAARAAAEAAHPSPASPTPEPETLITRRAGVFVLRRKTADSRKTSLSL
jgi:hypothetical protein